MNWFADRRGRVTKEGGMAERLGREERILAAGAKCPIVGCRSLAIAFTLRAKTHLSERQESQREWLFVCPRCEWGFRTTQDDLLFHSVPAFWLLGGISHA
jgi:hypothetical protein